MKRLLLFDLDGTLLTSEKVISEKTFAALMKAREMGYLIGISTSRSVKNSLSFTDRLVPDIITAFGDDLADIGMLKLCGTGIAMGNAREEVKKAADLVIGTNDADGIAEYINTGRCF